MPNDQVLWIREPSTYVNLLAGTFTKGDEFSTGNTLPLVGMPWGFNHYAIQTNHGKSAWWFLGSEHEFHWIRCTHQPSPWIGDYGYFLFGPQMGNFANDPTGFFEPRSAELFPHGMRFTTAPDGMQIRFAPTDHGGILSVLFPRSIKIDKRVCFGALESILNNQNSFIDFVVRRNSGSVGPDFGLYVHAHTLQQDAMYEHHDNIACFRYPQDSGQVLVRFGTSFISNEQARRVYEREINHLQIDQAWQQAQQVWDNLLGRFSIGFSLRNSGPISAHQSHHLSVFYTCLYRALTFPRIIDEDTGPDKHKKQHWSPYFGNMHHQHKIFTGIGVTDNGFWDTFRSVYPLLALGYPDHLKNILEGWVQAYREGGWIPKWASPGYRNSMVGTYGDVTIADGIVLGHIASTSYRDAYDALKRDAFDINPPPGGAVGRVGLRQYDQYGYIPYDAGVSDSVSRTLDFAYADYAISIAAQKLGHFDDANKLKQRSKQALTALFDSETGLMRPKSRSGQFKNPFSTIKWGDGYTEGCAWHHSFPAFDPKHLISLHGSESRLRAKLDQMLATASTFEPGGYGRAIHEMIEFRALAMGQYSHNNQPAHHILFLYALAGDPNTTSAKIHRVLDHAYGIDFFAGDEDNGEMGAWFVQSASGLFSLPGTSGTVIALAPLFDHMKIRDELIITAHRNKETDTAITEIWLNDTKKLDHILSYDDLRRPGRIDFYMTGNYRTTATNIPDTSSHDFFEYKSAFPRTSMPAASREWGPPEPRLRRSNQQFKPSAPPTKGNDLARISDTRLVIASLLILFIGFFLGRRSRKPRRLLDLDDDDDTSYNSSWRKSKGGSKIGRLMFRSSKPSSHVV